MDDKRIAFFNECDLILFFEQLKLTKKYKTWKQFYLKNAIPRNSFNNYKSGRNLLPENIFNKLLNSLDQQNQEVWLQKIYFKNSNWGGIKGGQEKYKKYPEHLERFRKIKREMRPTFDFNMKLNEKLCEFIGAFIGDGFIGKYGSHYMLEFTGDSRFDKEYLNEMAQIGKDLFRIKKPYFYKVKNRNVLRLKLYSKSLLEFLQKRFNFNKGKKCYTVKIPVEIINSDKKLIFATIRGIFDTDGCVFFDKRKIYKNPYPRITFLTTSPDLFFQLKDFLSNYFKLYTRKSKRRGHYLEVYGQKQFSKWMSLIGFSNSRHLNKIKSSLRRELNPRPPPYQGGSIPLRH